MIAFFKSVREDIAAVFATDPAARAKVDEIRKKLAEETYEKQLKDLDKRYGAYDWTSSLTVSSIFILLMLGLACARFATRDY